MLCHAMPGFTYLPDVMSADQGCLLLRLSRTMSVQNSGLAHTHKTACLSVAGDCIIPVFVDTYVYTLPAVMHQNMWLPNF